LPLRSIENGSYIIEAMETGRSFYFNGNVQNGGCITNLPTDCCVEVPVYADRTGLHPVYVGDLPVVCAALNRSNIDVHRLAREAAISGDPEILVMACAIDPLTATKVTLREAREMVSEMLEKERVWLPQFEGKKVRKTPVISIPCDVKRVEVPMDPALAITARFKELAE
jgi:alpha-galactosidase